MKKYLTIINIAWQRSITYRFTVFAYRVGEIMEVIVLILMWSAIYESQPVIKGFTLNEMITYILFGNLVNVIVRCFMAEFIAREIKDGKLSLFLVKPMEYFNYILTFELGRKTLAFLMSFLSQLIIILFFLDKIFINSDIAYLLLLAGMIILAFITELLIAYLIGMIAFWTDEVSGLYTTIDRLTKFFAGGYFPLNLLPAFFVNLSFALPFAYSFYIPAQLYLKKISPVTALKGLGVQLVWIVLLYLLIKITWKKGLRKYEGIGI